LTNPRNSEPKIFPLSNPQEAIYCSGSHGPIYGGGRDIFVVNNCDQSKNNYTNLGVGYRNDTGISGDQLFTGERNFQVKEIEVFTVSV
jgi:hypothetical protein